VAPSGRHHENRLQRSARVPILCVRLAG
jgi:hypothetical protein